LSWLFVRLVEADEILELFLLLLVVSLLSPEPKKSSSSNKFPTGFLGGDYTADVLLGFLGDGLTFNPLNILLVGLGFVPGLLNFGAIFWNGFLVYSNFGLVYYYWFKPDVNPYFSSFLVNLSLYFSNVDF